MSNRNKRCPFKEIIKIIKDERIDPITFPDQIKVLSHHIENVEISETNSEIIDELFFILVEFYIAEKNNQKFIQSMFTYINRSVIYVNNKKKLYELICKNMRNLLNSDYEKYLPFILKALDNIVKEMEDQVLDIVEDNFDLLFNFELVFKYETFGEKIKAFLQFCCEKRNKLSEMFMEKLLQLSILTKKSYDDRFKYITFIDYMRTTFKDILIVISKTFSKIQDAVFNNISVIFLESNDMLLQCALCNFFYSKITMNIHYFDILSSENKIVPVIVQTLKKCKIYEPFQMELLTLISYMVSTKGVEFMYRNQIEEIFIKFSNEKTLNSKNSECIVRSYLEILSNYHVFMALTSENASQAICHLNETIFPFVSCLICPNSFSSENIQIINKLTAFFNDHKDMSNFTDYQSFILKKHTFYVNYVDLHISKIVNSTFECFDPDYQLCCLRFINSLLNFTWGFSMLVDSSGIIIFLVINSTYLDINVYLLDKKYFLNSEILLFRIEILQRIVESPIFMSMLDTRMKTLFIAAADDSEIGLSNSNIHLSSCTN